MSINVTSAVNMFCPKGATDICEANVITEQQMIICPEDVFTFVFLMNPPTSKN